MSRYGLKANHVSITIPLNQEDRDKIRKVAVKENKNLPEIARMLLLDSLDDYFQNVQINAIYDVLE